MKKKRGIIVLIMLFFKSYPGTYNPVWLLKKYKPLRALLIKSLKFPSVPKLEGMDKFYEYHVQFLEKKRAVHEAVESLVYGEYPYIGALAISRLPEEKFVEFVLNDEQRLLWKAGYDCKKFIVDTFMKYKDLFDIDKKYEILNLLLRYDPENFGFYLWATENLPAAYTFLGYDGLKKLYEHAAEWNKWRLEYAYKKLWEDPQWTQLQKKMRLYFLEEVFMKRDFDWTEFKETGSVTFSKAQHPLDGFDRSKVVDNVSGQF